jgi:hypothetical protein
MNLDLSDTAVVVIDPQNDVLSPLGKNWEVLEASVTENNTVGHLVEIFTAAQGGGFAVPFIENGSTIVASPHKVCDGYQAALVNFPFLAHAVLNTDDVVAAMTVPTGGPT